MAKSSASPVLRFLQNEDGPNSVEYAVMLAMIIVVCSAAINFVVKTTNWQFNHAASALGS